MDIQPLLHRLLMHSDMRAGGAHPPLVTVVDVVVVTQGEAALMTALVVIVEVAAVLMIEQITLNQQQKTPNAPEKRDMQEKRHRHVRVLLVLSKLTP